MSPTPFGQDKFITVNQLQLHYVEWGHPRPSAHGAAARLSEPCSYLGYVQRRHGRRLSCAGAGSTRGTATPTWAPDGDYAPEAFIRDIVGFMDALNLGAGRFDRPLHGRAPRRHARCGPSR